MNFAHIAKSVLAAFYAAVNRVLPKNKRKVVFSSFPDASDNAWHLYRHIAANHSGLQLVWIVAEPHVTEKILTVPNAGNDLLVLQKRSALGMAHLLTARVVFFTHGLFSFVRSGFGQTIVNLWHGMPIKRIGLLDGCTPLQVPYAHYSISTSELYSGIISRCLNVPVDRVLPVGLPRNDSLTNIRREERKRLETALGLGAATRIFFWLPTFRKCTTGMVRSDAKTASFLDEFGGDFLERLDAALEANNASVVVKLHPMDATPEDQLTDFRNIRMLSARRWAASSLDLYEALSYSAGLITDLSSVVVDYIQTRRPIAITTKSLEVYTRGMLPDVAELLPSCYAISDCGDMIRFIAMSDGISSHLDWRTLQRFNSPTKPACEQLANLFIRDLVQVESRSV